MVARERLLVLDLLESYAREQDATVEVRREDGGWSCRVRSQEGEVSASGLTAREAIRLALEQAGVELPP